MRQWNNIPIPTGFKDFQLENESRVEFYRSERHMLNYFIGKKGFN